MSLSHLEHHLSLVEQQLDEASSALVDGDPIRLAHASTGLKQCAAEFLPLLQAWRFARPLPLEMVVRIKAVAAGLPRVQEGVHRKAAVVERGLQLLVPSVAKASTYIGASAPYASGMRPSGTFATVAA